MKLTTAIAITLALAVPALAAPAPAIEAPKASEPRPNLNCNPAGRRGIDNGIMLPARGSIIAVGQEFDVDYCSPTFHE